VYEVVDAVAPNFTYNTAVESFQMERPFGLAAAANRATLLADPDTFVRVAD
jgi:hypothetical protein